MTVGENGSSIAALDAIVNDAIAVTIAAPAASNIDEQEVIRRLEVALAEAVTRAAEMIYVLGSLKAKLDERLKTCRRISSAPPFSIASGR
jgi:hypothetical protein